jgi:O-antigen/teichoic acid export membrane protein
MSPASLTQRVANSSAWLAASRLLVRTIGLISTLILARLLTPGDFGLVALASAFYFVIETLSDFRFEQALLALQDTRDIDFDTAWTMNAARGLLVATIMVIGAYPYAELMDEERLTLLMLALALVPLIDGFKNPHFIRFEKEFNQRKEFTLQIAAKTGGFIVTLSLALIYRSYWALLAGMVTATTARVVLSYLLRPAIPSLTLASMNRLMNFSGWLMGGQLVTAAIGRAQFFLAGAFLPASAVGFLHVGSEIANMATAETLAPIRRVLLPALAQKAGNPEDHHSAFGAAMEVIIGLALPIGIGISLIAEQLVPLLLGGQWHGAINVMQFVGMVGALTAVSSMGETMLVSTGKTRPLFNLELMKLVYVLPGFWLGITLAGLKGVLVAWLTIALISLLVNLEVIRRHTGINQWTLLAPCWRSPLAVLMMAISVSLTRSWLPATGSGLIQDLGGLLLTMLAGAASYSATHLLLWHLVGRPRGFESRALEIGASLRLRVG